MRMTEVEGPKVREKVSVHVLVCPTKVCAWWVLMCVRFEAFREANEEQAAAMIDLYGVLDKPGAEFVLSIGRRHP